MFGVTSIALLCGRSDWTRLSVRTRGPAGTWSTQIRVRICVPAYAGRLSLFSRPDILILYDAIASTKSSVSTLCVCRHCPVYVHSCVFCEVVYFAGA
jgi:hypothetical protein